MAILQTRFTRFASIGAMLALGAACGDEHSSNKDDAGTADDVDGSVGKIDASEGTQTSPDSGGEGDAISGNTMEGDAGCEATNSCPSLDPLAPFRLNCSSLPANGVCQGGPREVLLVTESAGAVLMFDPFDGHFLGYFKRPASDYYLHGRSDYTLFTQGPDQCIWSVSNDDDLQIQRWETNGAYRDKPLKPHQILLSGQAPDYAVQDPLSIAFTADRVYVGSEFGDPQPRITRWTLDGSFDSVVLDDGTEANSMEVLGDGSLLLADGNSYSVIRVPTSGPIESVFSAGLHGPGQVSYESDGKFLIADTTLGEPVHEVELASGVATTVYPNISSSSNKYGITKLGNGNWLLAGGQFGVSSLDPLSVDPVGQFVHVWDDNVLDYATFRQIGRACVSDAFITSRAVSAEDESCAPPAGPTIFEENFEGATDFTGTGDQRVYKSVKDRGTTGVVSSLVAGVGVENSRALSVEGGIDGNNTGVYVTFPAAQPKYVSFYVNVESKPSNGTATNPNVSEGFFNLSNAAAVTNNDVYTRLLTTYTNESWLYANNSSAMLDLTKVEKPWVHVEMRDIDWTSRTYDLYVNCKRLAAGIGIPDGYGDTVDTLDLYNYDQDSDPAVALYDNILIK